MILLVDNYDSFSYNLYQMIGEINPNIKIIRNDELTTRQIAAMNPERVILSPGPGRPEDAGVCQDIVRELAGQVPLLGVCLGHQAICSAFGATITYAKRLMHGKTSTIEIDPACPIFNGCPSQVEVARYHSLLADPDTLPNELIVTGKTAEGEIMAVRHKSYPIYGVQFHPESVLTPLGKVMLRNFIGRWALLLRY